MCLCKAVCCLTFPILNLPLMFLLTLTVLLFSLLCGTVRKEKGGVVVGGGEGGRRD